MHITPRVKTRGYRSKFSKSSKTSTRRDTAAAQLRHRREADAGADATTPLQSSATPTPAMPPTTSATTTPAPAAATCDYTTRRDILATNFCGSTRDRHVCKQLSLPPGTEPNARFKDECSWDTNCGCFKTECHNCGAAACMHTCDDDPCYPTKDCSGVDCKCLPPPGTVLPDLPDPTGDGDTGVAAAGTTVGASTTTPAPGSDVSTAQDIMAKEATTNVTANVTANVTENATSTPMPTTSPLPAARKTMDPAEAKALASTVTTAVAAVIG